VKVISRNSVFRFKGQEADAQSIARQLGVQGVLTGNLRQVDDQMVINVELMDASDGHVILSRQYIRKAADLLLLQSNIAQDVAGNLRVKLSPEQQQILARQPTIDSEAYQLYLRGRSYSNHESPDDIHEAIKYYQQAVERDPGFA